MTGAMRVTKLYFVEIGSPKDFAELHKIAKRHSGRYHSRMGHFISSSFVFTKEENAKAFMDETKDWPQYGE